MGKTPVLKNTKWKAEQKMFVADAGTMTITHTLEFGAKKDVVIRGESYLPAHPAMYMNPDGTVDRIEASSSEWSDKGTYSFKRGMLTITTEDGHSKVYLLQDDGTFTYTESYGEILVFSRCTDE